MRPQRKKLVTEISHVAKSLADIIRESDTTVKIPNSEWSIMDMTAHVIVTQKILTSLVNGRNSDFVTDKNKFIDEVRHNISREYIAKINKKFLTKYDQRNNKILANELQNEFQKLIKEIAKIADTKTFKTHYGKVDLLVLISYCLTHLLIHGSIIAKTLKKPLPATKENTSLIIPFIKVIMVKLYDTKAAKNLHAIFVFSIYGVEKFSLLCTPKKVTVTNDLPQVVDCYMKMDPLTFFLVSNGYMSQWKALFLGKISLAGRKPWLALKLPALFKGL
jgi:SCP-2 sterol transfer family